MKALYICLVVLGCDSSPPPRDVSFDTTVAAGGLSEELSFEIPEHTRSITIVVKGAPAPTHDLQYRACGARSGGAHAIFTRCGAGDAPCWERLPDL